MNTEKAKLYFTLFAVLVILWFQSALVITNIHFAEREDEEIDK
jgi:hypothetical protein